MIIDGQVYRDGHPSWCLCDQCEAEHPGKRDFYNSTFILGDVEAEGAGDGVNDEETTRKILRETFGME